MFATIVLLTSVPPLTLSCSPVPKACSRVMICLFSSLMTQCSYNTENSPHILPSFYTEPLDTDAALHLSAPFAFMNLYLCCCCPNRNIPLSELFYPRSSLRSPGLQDSGCPLPRVGLFCHYTLPQEDMHGTECHPSLM